MYNSTRPVRIRLHFDIHSVFFFSLIRIFYNFNAFEKRKSVNSVPALMIYSENSTASDAIIYLVKIFRVRFEDRARQGCDRE